MRRRKNPYTPGALALQRHVPANKAEVIDYPIRSISFTESGFELETSDGLELKGVVFRAGTRIADYMENVANAAILIESALRDVRETTHLSAFTLSFDESYSAADDAAALRVLAHLTDSRKCEVSVSSPIAFATKALCIVVAEAVLNHIAPRAEPDTLLVSKLADPLRFNDLKPSDLVFEILGDGKDTTLRDLERYTEDLIARADNDIVNRLKPSIQYEVARPAINLTIPPEVALLEPFESAITKFFVTSVGDHVGMGEDWSQGLWSGLELFADGRIEIRITRFTEQFASWDAGMFVQDVRARQQICMLAGMVGHVYGALEPSKQFKRGGSVRISLSRGAPQTGDFPKLRAELLQGGAEILEISSDGDARSAFLSIGDVEQSVVNLLSGIASVASALDLNVVRQLVAECVRGGLIGDLKSQDFGPASTNLNPTVPQAFAKSAYLGAYKRALDVAGAGVQVYADIEGARAGALEFGRFPLVTDVFADTKFVGRDVYGGRIESFMLNPRTGCFCVTGVSDIGIVPQSPDVIAQFAAVSCALGSIAGDACAAAGVRGVPVTVALQFHVEGAVADPTSVTLRFPATAPDAITLSMDAVPSDAMLTLDQMDKVGAYPTLFVKFYSANEMYRLLFTSAGFEAFCASVRRILGLKTGSKGSYEGGIPFKNVAADMLGYRRPGANSSEAAGSLKAAVAARRLDLEKVILQTAMGGDALDESMFTEVKAAVEGIGQLVDACVFWGYQTEAARDRLMFMAAPRAPKRSLVERLWATRCMTFLILTESKTLLALLTDGGAITTLESILQRQERNLTKQIGSLNKKIVSPDVQHAELLVLESRREAFVADLGGIRALLKRFEQVPNYIRAMTSEAPDVVLSPTEIATAEDLFEAVTSAPPPRITVPPSTPPADTFLPPSDSPIAMPHGQVYVEESKVLKYLELKGDSHISDVLETSAADIPDVAAVDCMALGELRWLVRSMRQGIANVQGALDIDVAGTYRFAYTTHEGVSYMIDTQSLHTAPCVTVFISTRMDISRADVVETVYQAVAECMEHLHEHSGSGAEDGDEDEVDRFDIYDALTEV